MKLLKNSEIPIDEWEAFMSVSPHSTPFQSPAFYGFLEQVDRHSAECFAVTVDGRIKALAVVHIQKEKGVAGFFSKRAIISGGPLTDEDCPQALDFLLKEVNSNIDPGTIYVESRNLSDFSHVRGLFESNGYRYVPHLNFRVDTGDRERMISNISSSRYRQIRKAQSRSVRYEEARGKDDVRAFYMMLSGFYRKKVKKPLPGEDFFLKFFEYGIGIYLLVCHEDKLIAGIMCPLSHGKTVYELYVCGLDDEYKELYPSVMATWSAMDYACSHNYLFFDFMGAGKPGESYGVRDFKARFGGRLVEEGRFLRVRKPLLYRIGSAMMNLKKTISR
jgi:lipid II:glycine glycyltransferase (peptidoglycan interpeptide bridge formation enzyme)